MKWRISMVESLSLRWSSRSNVIVILHSVAVLLTLGGLSYKSGRVKKTFNGAFIEVRDQVAVILCRCLVSIHIMTQKVWWELVLYEVRGLKGSKNALPTYKTFVILWWRQSVWVSESSWNAVFTCGTEFYIKINVGFR